MQNPLTQHKKEYPVLVNRTRVIATAEDKANITGFRWTRPQTMQPGFVEKRNAKGDFLYYTRTEPVTIQDVDGLSKHTIKTSFYEADQQTLKDEPKPAFGDWVDGLAGAYHGKLSRHWTQEQLTLAEIINELNSGYAIAPGLFTPPENESKRSGDFCEHRQIILFDADEWTPEHPAPRNLDDFITRYPTLITDFYWIGESISSRTSLKPEFRARLKLVLPEPIGKGDDDLWQTAIDAIVTKYPFVARGVGIDKVRLSFGNARPECENRVLGGFLSTEIFGQWKQIASETQADAEALRIETENKEIESKARRAEKQTVTTELKKRGYAIADNQDPIRVFCEVNTETLLIDTGLATRLSGTSWNWSESSAGRSFELDNGVIKPFSNSMQTVSPETDGTKPVNAHRFILYYLHNLDMTKDSDKHELRCILADLNYGTHPEAYQKQQKRLYEIAKNEGLDIPNPPRTRKAPIRLSHQTDYQPESETLDTLRKALPVGLLEWQERTAETDHQHMLILAFGAGTGKSTASIINLKQYADISPTIELADEKHGKALFEGVHAMRHRSRNHNRAAAETYTPENVPIGLDAEAGDVPCAFPDICNTLAAKGYSASSLFCPVCPRFDECRADGYLSQWDLMPKHDAIFFSYQDDFFSDPQYESFIETITKGKDAVLVLDEVDPATLPPKREYTTENLKQLCERFGNLDAGVFLGMLIEKTAKAITPHDWTKAVTELLATFQDDDLDAINIDLEAIPVKTRFEKAQPAVCDLAGVPLYKTIAHITYGGQERICAVLSRRKGENQPPIATFEMLTNDDAKWVSDAIIPNSGWQAGQEYESLLTINKFCHLGFGSLDTTETVDRLPKQLTNFTKDLREYVQSVNSETPACHENKDGKAHLGWVYYLRPSMNARRGVLISAGGIEDIIKEQYAHTEIEIEAMHGKPPAWKPRNVLWQVSTGRYTPAQKWIEKDKDNEAIGLRDAGKAVMKMIAKEAETGKNTLIVGAKDFTSAGTLTHVPEIANILAMDNVFSINHHHAEGVNQYDFCEIAFVFLYQPRPDEMQRIASRIYRDNTLIFDREKMTIQKSGVEFVDVLRYTDARVQACFDKECEKRLMQAITRLRQMIHENKRVYLLTSEPVSSLPITPRLCTLDDLKACQDQHGTLDSLETYIKTKENMSIDEAADADGVTKSTAYRRTETKRAKDKAELKSEAYRLYHEKNMTQQSIADLLGKERRTIIRWLANYQF